MSAGSMFNVAGSIAVFIYTLVTIYDADALAAVWVMIGGVW